MDTACSIRLGVPDDAPVLARLHVRSWQWAYRGHIPDAYLDGLGEQIARREAMWRGQIAKPADQEPLWVAERDGRVVGLCNTAPARDGEPGTAELLSIYLEPEAVGAGVGAALMRRALAHMRAQGYRSAVLWVLAGNDRARRFYEHIGWSADGVEKEAEVWGVPIREVRYRIDLGQDASGR